MARGTVTGHLSERSFVRMLNVPMQIPKFDAKPNPKPNPNPSLNPNPNPMPILFGQMTLRTSELLPGGLPSTRLAVFIDTS